MTGNAVVPIVFFGWIPAAQGLFAFLTPRRAVVVALVGGWLFLPNATFKFSGLPDYTKVTAVVTAILVGVFLFDRRRFRTFRARWYDIPMLIFCLSPMASSIDNGLGTYDGFSCVLSHLMKWGMPYFIGRVYFNSYEGMCDLAMAIFVGGLIYIPLCLYEIRMSPRLHKSLYGFRTRSPHLGFRDGGYRPMVFLWSFVPVAHWMSVTTAAGYWLWRGARLRLLWGMPVGLLLLVMIITVFLCKTYLAYVLVPLGIVLAAMMIKTRRSWPLLVFVVLVPTFMGLRISGVVSGEALIDTVSKVNETRARSLGTRIRNENEIAEKAMRRPIFGWGRWSRWMIQDEKGRDQTIPDGLWVITLGQQGLLGLVAFVSIYAIALWRVAGKMNGYTDKAMVAPAAAVATVVLLTFINIVPNTTFSPIITAALGGLIAMERYCPPSISPEVRSMVAQGTAGSAPQLRGRARGSREPGPTPTNLDRIG